MELKINQNPALIGLRNHFSQIKLDINDPHIELEASQPKVKLQQELARVKCDSTQACQEAGFYRPAALSRKFAGQSREHCQEYIVQVAQNGDQMAAVERFGASAMIQAYAQQGWDEVDYNVARIPRSPVDVQVIPGQVKTDWQMGETNLSLKRGAVHAEDRGEKLEIYLRQKSAIHISFQPDSLNIYV